MVYGRIWIGGRSPLVVIQRDSSKPKNGFSSWSYIQALEEDLLNEEGYEPGRFFSKITPEFTLLKRQKNGSKSMGFGPLTGLHIVLILIQLSMFGRK